MSQHFFWGKKRKLMQKMMQSSKKDFWCICYFSFTSEKMHILNTHDNMLHFDNSHTFYFDFPKRSFPKIFLFGCFHAFIGSVHSLIHYDSLPPLLHQFQHFSSQSYHIPPTLISHLLIPLINSLTSSFQPPLLSDPSSPPTSCSPP